MFRINDLVVCIKTKHPFHVSEPELGRFYTLAENPQTVYGGFLVASMRHIGDLNFEMQYALDCFSLVKSLTKLEKLIYAIR